MMKYLRNKYKNLQNNYLNDDKEVGKILFCLGVGGILLFRIYYLLFLNEATIIDDINLYFDNKDQINNFNTVSDKLLTPSMVFFVLFCMIIILISLGIFEGNKNIEKRIIAFLICIFSSSISFINIMFTYKIKVFNTIVLWLSFSYLIWITVSILCKIYKWAKEPDKDGKTDVAKLVFIWSIITYIITKLVK